MEVYGVFSASIDREFHKVSLISSNVANVATPGFKRWMHEAVAPADDLSIAVRDRRDLSSGKPFVTGRRLDVFLPQDVYMVLDGATGDRFSRGGQLSVDQDGRLLTAEGHAVSVDNQRGTAAGTEVRSDGVLTRDGVPVGRLRFVYAAQAVYGGGGVYTLSDARPLAEGEVTITPGAYEASNVRLTDEIVGMMGVLRHMESVQRILRHHDSVNERVLTSLGKF